MKSLYVINLDKKRIFIVVGSLMILFSLAFVAGTMTKTDPDNLAEREGSKKQQDVAANEPFDQGRKFENAQKVNQGDGLLGSIPGANARELSSHDVAVEDDPLVYAPRQSRQSEDQAGKYTATEESFHNISGYQQKNEALKTGPEKRKNLKKKENSEAGISSEKEKKVFYTIQIASFKQKEDALQLQKKMSRNGIKARVDKGLKSYFVNVGRADKVEKLQQTLEQVKAKFTKTAKTAMIVKRKLG